MCGRLGLDVLAAPVCCSITERKRQRNRRGGAQNFQHRLCTPQLVGLLRCRPCGCAPPCSCQPSWRRAAGVGGEEQLGRMCARLSPHSLTVAGCESGQSDCLRVVPAAPTHAAKYKLRCDAFFCAGQLSGFCRPAAAIVPTPRRLAHGRLPGPANFEPRSPLGQSMLQ